MTRVMEDALAGGGAVERGDEAEGAEARARRLETRWQNRVGMTVLGVIGLLYAVACCASEGMHAASGAVVSEARVWFGGTMGSAGALALLAGRMAWGQRHARLLVGALMVLLALMGGVSLSPEMGTTPALTTAEQAPLLLALTLGLLVYRPLHGALLAALVPLATVLGVVAGHGWEVGPDLGPVAASSALLAAGAFGLGLLLYRLRLGIIAQRIALLRRHRYLERHNRRLLDQRMLALDEAQMARVRAVRSLAAGVAHEINTPLGSLRSALDLVQRAASRVATRDCADWRPGQPLPRDLERAVRTLDKTLPLTQTATDRIAEVVRQLSRFAHLDRAGQVPTDVREGLAVTLDLMRVALGPELALRRRLEAVPPVQGDPHRLNLVFSNLVLNAAQATGDAGEIRVGCAPRDEWVEVTVEDNGRGIPAHHLEHLFEPGFTGEGEGDGAGLGLSIARRVVEDHGGTIEVQSEDGQGTRVTVRLPAADAT